MRIWIVNQYALPPSEAGGTRHHALARALIAAGHEVVLIASSQHYATRQDTRLGLGEGWRREVLEGVPFVWVRAPGYTGGAGRMGSMATFAWRVLAWADRFGLGRPDVVVGSSPHLFAAWAAERLAARHGVPFVLEIRDLWPLSLVEVAGLAPHHPAVVALGWLERHLYHRARRIVTLLPGAATHVEARGGTAAKVAWVPNGVDLAAVPEPLPPPAHERLELLYAGTHGVANGLDALLDAAALLEAEGLGARVRFRFVGEGPEKARLAARAAAEGLPAAFEPAVPKDQVPALLASADAFVVTLRDAPLYRFGISLNKLTDYLAAGRPTIFGARAFNNPIAEADAGLVTPPEDARAMADAVKALLALGASERWAMGQRGRLHAEEHYDTRVLARRLEAVLADAVARHVPPRPWWAAALKRALDVAVAGALLVLLAPVMLVVAAWIRVATGGPALFTQERPGHHGRLFRIRKFRSMTDERDAAGELLPDAERLKPWGQWLRKLSLDELPQLWNVLVGDLSLVGPRPLLVKYLPRYTPDQARRHEVPPGITGWAQVNGRNAISWDERFALDVWYVEHWSLALDLRILAMTAMKVLKRSDVSAADHATMPEFRGQEEEPCASPSTAPADTGR